MASASSEAGTDIALQDVNDGSVVSRVKKRVSELLDFDLDPINLKI